MAKSKLVQANQKIEATVVGAYKKIEQSAVGSYSKIEDGFIDKYLTKDGETIEEARVRLQAEENERKNEQAKRRNQI